MKRASALVRRAVSVLVSISLLTGPVLGNVSVAHAAGPRLTVSASGSEAAQTSKPKPKKASPTIVREVVERRTAGSKNYLLSDGSHRVDLYSEPVHVKNSKGEWRAIDSSLVADPVAPGSIRTAATPATTSFRENGLSGAPVTVRYGKYTATIDMLDAAEGNRLRLGETVRYNGVATDADLVYEPREDGVKETVVLHSAAAPSTYRFFMGLNGLQVRTTLDGTYSLVANDTGKEVGVIEPLRVWDSSEDKDGDPALCAGAKMTVEPAPGGAIVTYDLPEAWLSDPARVFPVSVDPNLLFVTGSGTAGDCVDTFVNSAAPTSYFRSYDYLSVGKNPANNGIYRSLLKFDLAAIPTGADINSATFKTYCFEAQGSSSHATYLRKVSTSWESTVTWNTRPTSTSYAQQNVSGSGMWVSWDVKTALQSWVDEASPNYGFLLMQNDADSTTYFKRHRSSDYGTGTTYRPQMSVTYNVPEAPVTVSGTKTALEWFREIDRDSDGDADNRDDVDSQGRGSVEVTWTPSANAYGYKIMAFDGNYYRQVGQVYGQQTTSWSSEGSGLYPSDSEIESWTENAYTGNGFARASNPSVAEDSVDAPATGSGVVVSDGRYLYARAWGDEAGPDSWVKVGTGYGETLAGSLEGTVGPDFSAKPVRSAFYQDGFIYNGYADSATTVTGVAASSAAEATATRTFTFDAALLARSTGSALTTASSDVMLAADDEHVYSVAESQGSGHDGFRVRIYDRDGNRIGSDHDIGESSYVLSGVLADGRALYLVEWAGTSAARVTKVRVSDWAVINRWTIDQGDTKAANGCFDAANRVFWLGPKNTTGQIARYAGPGFDLRDNPQRMYQKMANSSYDNSTNYWFRVIAFNEFGEQSPVSTAYWNPTLDNRTVGVNDDPRHPEHDMGELLGHAAGATLDEGALQLDITDLSIASWGPEAALSRHYRSDLTTATAFSQGWRFNFEQKIVTESATEKTWVDAQGERHTFTKQASGSSVWAAPNGMFASLESTSGGDAITFTDRSVLAFTSGGVLKSETDANGNATTYIWFAGDLTIEAANGQSIEADLDVSGDIVSATYGTEDGTRTVEFDVVSATEAHVTQFPNTTDARQFDYLYEGTGSGANRLSGLGIYDPRDVENLTATACYAFGYDAQGRVASWQLVMGSTYDGAAYTVSYGSAEATVTGSGHDIYAWNPTGTVSGHTNPLGGASASTYDAANEPTQESTPEGGQTTTQYDAAGNAVYEWDTDGDRTSYVYDASGNAIRETSPKGSTTYRTFDSHGNVTAEEKVLDASGARSRTENTYSAAGLLTSERSKIDASTWAQTDYSDFADNGEPQTITQQDVKLSADSSPVDLTATKSYDAFGNLLWEKDASSVWVAKENTYTPAGRLATSEVVTGTVTHNFYDTYGNVQETSTTAGSEVAERTWTEHDPRGEVVDYMKWNPEGTPWLEGGYWCTLEWSDVDSFGRLSLIRTYTGSDYTYKTRSYDAAGNMVSEQDSATGATSYTSYDAESREVATLEPGADESEATTMTYDADGNVTREENPDDTWVESEFDEEGNETERATPTEDATASATSAYDLSGRLASNVNEDGSVTTHTYDLLGRETAAGIAGKGASAVVYNSLGWVLSRTDADGITTTTTYDEAGRELSVTVGGKTTETEYDSAGRATTRTEPDGRATHTSYDAFGRVTREWQTLAGSEDPVKDVRTAYDAFSRVKETSETAAALERQITYNGFGDKPLSQTLAYAGATSEVEYDLERGTETTRAVSAGALDFTRKVTSRDAKGIPTAYSVTGAGSRSMTYDAVGKLLTQTGYGLGTSGAAYTYGASGRKTAESLDLAYPSADSTAAYSYTDGGRLASATIAGAATTYHFDQAGNLDEVRASGESTISLDYDTESKRLLSMGTTDFGWDEAHGWRTSARASGETSVTYQYTDSGRLSHYEDPNRSVEATYAYDGAGQRTSAVVTEGSLTTTTTYVYDGLSLLSLSAQRSDETTFSLAYFYDEAGAPWAAIYAGTGQAPTLFYLVTTDRGDVVELLDGSGNAFSAYSYDAWGNPETPLSRAAGSIDATLAAAICERQPLRYAGYAYDGHSGLYYCSQRYYDPATFQFLTKDPARDDGEGSAYQYCGGDPVGRVDPGGEWWTYYRLRLTRDTAREWNFYRGNLKKFKWIANFMELLSWTEAVSIQGMLFCSVASAVYYDLDDKWSTMGGYSNVPSSFKKGDLLRGQADAYWRATGKTKKQGWVKLWSLRVRVSFFRDGRYLQTATKKIYSWSSNHGDRGSGGKYLHSKPSWWEYPRIKWI